MEKQKKRGKVLTADERQKQLEEAILKQNAAGRGMVKNAAGALVKRKKLLDQY